MAISCKCFCFTVIAESLGKAAQDSSRWCVALELRCTRTDNKTLLPPHQTLDRIASNPGHRANILPLTGPPSAGRGRADGPLASTAAATGGRDVGAAMAKTGGSRTSRFLRQSRSWANIMRRSHSPQKPTSGSRHGPPRASSGIFGSLQKGLRDRMSRHVAKRRNLSFAT